MLGLYVTAPIACFRKGLAREYLETEPLPPPSTCYGFLLSLVGEADRQRHLGCRVTPVLIGDIHRRPSAVLRTVWRVKKTPLGSSGNTRPDYQQLHTHTSLVIWLDSAAESAESPPLEQRVATALDRPDQIDRFGGLCLGESTHLVDEVMRLDRFLSRSLGPSGGLPEHGYAFLTSPRGRHSLPVWVDHVGAAGTVYAVGEFERRRWVEAPPADRLPKIVRKQADMAG